MIFVTLHARAFMDPKTIKNQCTPWSPPVEGRNSLFMGLGRNRGVLKVLLEKGIK
ncbi:MAG: hypothetical protein GY917_32275 [Planctomycetaceae bacterium]|nr:hypothetical protein [Planctomycetaceae bacterium]